MKNARVRRAGQPPSAMAGQGASMKNGAWQGASMKYGALTGLRASSGHAALMKQAAWAGLAAWMMLGVACGVDAERQDQPGAIDGRPGQGRSPITGGSETEADPAVAALVLRRPSCDDEDQAVLCTGTLVAERVVLTAGHCIEPYGRGRLEVRFGTGLAAPASARRALLSRSIHPEYTEVSSDFDAAFVVLDSPVSIAPLPVHIAALDASWVGREVRLVGFGETAAADQPAGTKRTGTAVITKVDAATFEIAPGPALTCHGDSGGPVMAVVDGIEYLIGVTSTGDTACLKWGVAVRADVLVPGFLGPAMAGDPAAALPSPSIGFEDICEAPCGEDAECPGDLLCNEGADGARHCVVAGQVAGVFEESCETGAQCPSGVCAALGEACRCSAPCDGEGPAPAAGAGCVIGGADHGAGPWALAPGLIWAAGWARRRRRARVEKVARARAEV